MSANRQIRLAARDLKRQISDCAAIAAGKAAADLAAHCSAARPGDLLNARPLVITPEQAATLLRLLRDPAAYALTGWESELTPEEMAEHIADLDSSLRLLGSPDSFATLKRSHR